MKELQLINNNLSFLKDNKIIDENKNISSLFRIGKIKLLKNYAKILSNNQEIIVEFDDLYGAYEDDFVVAKIIFNPKKIRAKVFKILKKSDKKILSYYKNKNFFSIKENILLDGIKNTFLLKNLDIVVIQNKKVVKKIGNFSNNQMDEFVSLALFNEEYRLDKDEKTDSFNLDDILKDREDLTNLDFITIDPITAKDFDDAIYFDENTNTLFVAIADVSSFVKEGSELDFEAQKRGFSIYLPHKAYPMLPEILSNDLCSLKPNEIRAAFVCKMRIKNFKVIESSFFEAKIISKRRYNYDEFDKLIEQDKLDDNIKALFKLTQQIRKKRLYRGLDLNSNEIKLTLDNGFNILDSKIELNTSSHQLIEECMLLANIEAAKQLKQVGIFRTHDEMDLKKFQQLLTKLNEIGIKAKLKNNIHSTIESIQHKALSKGLEQEVNELLIKSQAKAKYSYTKKNHFGLGFDEYSHFTSPIRRYSDLILHRIIKTKKIPKNLEYLVEVLTSQEEKIDNITNDFKSRIYARFAKNNIGKIFDAIIVEQDIAKTISFPLGLECKVINNSYKIFTKIKIKIKSVDMVKANIEGEVIR